MRYALLLLFAAVLALGMCSEARAEIYYEDSRGDRVRVTDLPCPEKILAHIPEEHRPGYVLAVATVGYKGHIVCAALVGFADRPGVPFVHLVNDQGATNAIPLSRFKRVNLI